jgi:hypothetical protein
MHLRTHFWFHAGKHAKEPWISAGKLLAGYFKIIWSKQGRQALCPKSRKIMLKSQSVLAA